MGVLEWKADMYDKYQSLIGEGKPIWEWDEPSFVDNKVRLAMCDNATGEIRVLILTMTDLVQLNRTGAFDRHGDTYEKDRKRFEEFVKTVSED